MPLYDPRAPADRPPAMVQVIKTEEKGSDVNLASYLMLDACRADCDVAVVITNDSDLREPVRIVQEDLGMPIGVVNPHPAHRRSAVIAATFFRQLRPNVVRKSQFPEIVKDGSGRSIRRPAGW
jgi:NYN domain